MSEVNMDNYYYNIEDDIAKSPDNWCYIIVGGRNTGKTYSALKSCLVNKRDFVFVKRTIDDVNLLCETKQAGDNSLDFDVNPFKAINFDMGCNIRAFKVKNGLGGFYACDEENNPVGKPIGYIIALSAVTKYKGFDLSSRNYEHWLIFDEFIPQPWDRINRKEGEQLMDLYKTVSRDREHRGNEALKLICLANATRISNPTCNILEITDKLVDMQIHGSSYFIDNDRGIFVHQIRDNIAFMETEKQSQIYKAMAGTDWGRMALNNDFAYDDFTAVKKSNLKGYIPYTGVKYKSHNYYIYEKEGSFYMTLARANVPRVYNLKVENDQKAFYYDFVMDLQDASIENRMIFEQYTMYDLIMNYRQFFKIT